MGTDSTCSSEVDRDWTVHYYTPVVGCHLALLLTLQLDDSEADVTTGLLHLFFTYACKHLFYFFSVLANSHVFVHLLSSLCVFGCRCYLRLVRVLRQDCTIYWINCTSKVLDR